MRAKFLLNRQGRMVAFNRARRGEPITKFCDEQELTIRQRLDLFIRVCAAIAHAHQKMIVHRDLKPSNILVTSNGGAQQAQVKVIDFGIAKALVAHAADRTLLTESGQMIGTPEYMSPEQARSDGSGDILSTGYNAGEWNGAGIRSAAAAANPGYALGFAEASDTFSTFPAIFAGQSVDNTTVLVRYTRYGDANLDGTVNLNDFNRLAANFGQSNRRWSHGDFDFSTNVNLNDFNLLAGNFGMSGSSPDWLRGREANRSSSSTSIDDERDLWIDQPGGAWQDVAR